MTWKCQFVIILIVTGLIAGSGLVGVGGQRLTTSTRQSTRRCQPHVPLPVDDSREWNACQREVAGVSGLERDPALNKRIYEIIPDDGYSLRVYSVTTRDGYILSVFRVNGSVTSPPRYGKPSVILAHGLGSSSEGWLALPRHSNLVYKLVDAGYDVWLVDNRGAEFSQGHTTLNADRDLSYWDFSFHEMGIYDLPAVVDLVLEETGNPKVHYVGHSQGGVLFLIGASIIPELNDKFHGVYLMAPAAYLGGAYDPLFTSLLPLVYSPLRDVILRILRGRLQRRDPRILSTLFGILPHDLCTQKAILCGICDDYLLDLYNFNPSQMNYTNIPYILARIFNVDNLRSDLHFGQNILSCTFRQYDHGEQENLRRYGSAEPPPYNLTRVHAPLSIIWAEQDSLVTPTDIQRLIDELPPTSLRGVYRVNDDTFTHGDFAVARDADVLVYRDLIRMMNNDLLRVAG